MTLALLTEPLDLPHVRVVGYMLRDEDTIVLDIEFELPVATEETGTSDCLLPHRPSQSSRR
jgi:hypothetical protein